MVRFRIPSACIRLVGRWWRERRIPEEALVGQNDWDRSMGEAGDGQHKTELERWKRVRKEGSGNLNAL